MFQQLWRVNITGCVIQSPEHDLAEWRSASNCVIRILAERSLVQPTDKKKKTRRSLRSYNRDFLAPLSAFIKNVTRNLTTSVSNQ